MLFEDVLLKNVVATFRCPLFVGFFNDTFPKIVPIFDINTGYKSIVDTNIDSELKKYGLLHVILKMWP